MLHVDDRDRARWAFPAVALLAIGAVYLRVVGLPSLDLHGPFHRLGVMDPFCGGTRATYLLVRGDLAGAWSWNPLVPMLAASALVVTARVAAGWLTGKWLVVGLPRRAWVLLGVALLIAVEINQQLQAGRLMHGTVG